MSFYIIQYPGLTTIQSNDLLKKHGKNVLPEKPQVSSLLLFISQLKNPLVYVLLFAAIITMFLNHWSDTLIILLSVFINTILGFIQEKKANDSLTALKSLVQTYALVIRDAREQKIHTSHLVPGDLVILNAGDKIPADGVMLEANRLFVSEAAITGESDAVSRIRSDKVFMGTVIISGQGLLQVEHTGSNTEIGKIASSIQESKEPTPLAKQLNLFSRKLSVFILVLTVLVFFIGLLLGNNPVEIFITSVALAVSAIPEGLLVSFTAVLALGMQRILLKQGLVRNLASAETLGGVTTICTDKTGTLTYGKMAVQETQGDIDKLAFQVTIANDMADPLEIAASNWSKTLVLDGKELFAKYARLDSIPFSSETKYFAVLAKHTHNNILFINGAPEVVLEMTALSSSEKSKIRLQIKELSQKGMRLIGYIQKPVNKAITSIDADNLGVDYTWVGFLAFSDPVRPDVSQSLKRAMLAGIKLVIITGDYADTAKAVLAQLDINVSQIYLGTDLTNMTQKHLEKLLKSTTDVKLFARTSPAQKLQIINALKANGEVVAMLGDGVNDAPALARSDIGVVVNEATDVAKETADLILLNSSFTTVVDAVEEGRGIFENIRKVILYLMSGAFQEISTILLALITGFPSPATASQLLWINLVSDGFPSLALTIDTKSKDIMQDPPRDTSSQLIAPWMKYLMGIVSLASGFFAFILFAIVYNDTGNLILARSVAFATMGVNSLLYVYSIRHLKNSIIGKRLFDNKYLQIAVLAGLILQVFPFLFVETRQFFQIVWPSVYWIYIFGASVLTLILIEISKWIFRRQLA